MAVAPSKLPPPPAGFTEVVGAAPAPEPIDAHNTGPLDVTVTDDGDYSGVDELPPPPPPPGFTQDANVPMDDKPVAQSPEELVRLSDQFFKERRSAQEIRDLTQRSGFTLGDEDNAKLDEYDAWLAQNPEGVPNFKTLPPAPAPETSAGGAFWRGLQDMALFGGADELEAAAGAVGNKIGTVLGLNNSTADFGDIYDAIRNEREGLVDADKEEHGTARGFGQATGIVPTFGLPVGRIAKEANYLRKGAMAGGVGAGYGTLGGALGAEPGQRLEGAGEGAAVGGTLGVILPPALTSFGRMAMPILERTGLANLGREAYSGVNALARRAGLDPVAMMAKAREYREAGVEPALVDVVDDSGRGVFRAAASKMTPGRELAEREAKRRSVGLQDSVAEAADIIHPNRKSSKAIVEDITKGRNFLADDQYAQIRDVSVPISTDITNVLSTGEGRTAVRMAERLLPPEEREALRQVQSAVQTLSKLDPRLPASARAQIERQVMGDTKFTVDMADKISRSLLGRANTGGNPGAERILTQLGRTIRNAARQAEPRYGQALDKYAEQSSLADAVEVGKNFLKSGNADDFAAEFNALSADPTQLPKIRDVQGSLSIKPVEGDPYGAEHLTYTTPDGRTIDATISKMDDFLDEHDIEEALQAAYRETGEYIDMSPDMVESLHKAGMDDQFADYLEGAYNRIEAAMNARKGDSGQYVIDIDKIGDWGERANSFGPGVMKDIVQELRRQRPNINSLIGNRVTGAKKNVFGAEGYAEVSIVPKLFPGPSEQDIARASAAETVRTAASESPRAAAATADKLAEGAAQGRRNEALLGTERANRLSATMGGRVRFARNARDIAASTGSQTQVRAQDSAAADDIMGFAAAAATGGKSALISSIKNTLSGFGMRDVDAERLIRDGLDPTKLDDAISYLARRVGKAEARNIMGQVRRASNALTAEELGDNPPRRPIHFQRGAQ